MSKPRPIHSLHRPLVSTPNEAEPSYSYEQESFLGGKEEDAEDDFYRRMGVSAGGGSRRESVGSSSTPGSFWRNSSTTASSAESERAPRFSSMSLNTKKNDLARKTSPSVPSLPKHDPETPPPKKWNESFHKDSSASMNSNSSNHREAKKKDAAKQRTAERRTKMKALDSEIEPGHIVDDRQEEAAEESPPPPIGNIALEVPPSFARMMHASSLDRSSSDQSTGSLLYVKTPNSGVLLGKTSSLIFPTGVEAGAEVETEADRVKRRKINMALDQCETVRFPFKKKLMLNNLDLSAADIPLKDLCGTTLGNTLHKLSLAGNNRLGSVPALLVQNLPVLKTLELSQCELTSLPEKWNLPKLTRLNLSHNGFTEFPEESVFEGLPELTELVMYGNKVAEITVPQNPKLLSKLEKLDLGYNDLYFLPPELDQLTSLKVLKVMNNYLTKVPMQVCDIDLKTIDVSNNPVTEPPAETCERGVASMRRYWHCIKLEEQAEQKSRDVKRRIMSRGKKKKKYPGLGIFGSKPSPQNSPNANRHVNEAQAAAPPVPEVAMTGIPASVSIRTPSQSTVDSPKADDNDSKVEDSSLVEGETSLDRERASEGWVEELIDEKPETITVNDTLKVIFVGMAMVGKTSMIKRLIEGENAIVPTREERTVGVDIYQWDPKEDQRFEHIDTRINFEDTELGRMCGDVNVKLSVWDFAGQHVYHATHELFFSNRALYVLVWDMGATNTATWKKERQAKETGAFSLSLDLSDEEDEEDEDDFTDEEEARRADRALERDIDEKIQFWIDCIQSSAPGAAILPVASFSDYFGKDNEAEAKRRCNLMKHRLLLHEERRLQGIKQRLREYTDQNRASDEVAKRLRRLLCSYTRPKLIFGDTYDDSVVRVSGTQFTGFDLLTERIINIATGRYKGQRRYPIFHGHVGARIPRMRLTVREEVRRMREKFKVVEWGHFMSRLNEVGLSSVEDISDALHFLTNTGELAYFGSIISNARPIDNPMESDGRKANLSSRAMSEETDSDDAMDEYEVDDDDDEDRAVLSMDDTGGTAPTDEEGSWTTSGDTTMNGLSQFVFLNPRWLVAAVACILRHDLDREIKEARRIAANGPDPRLSQAASFYETHFSCPVITSDDACLLWSSKRITKLAAKKAQEHSSSLSMTPFEFLQLLLIRFCVFVPIDLSIEKALLGGKEYARLVEDSGESGPEIGVSSQDIDQSTSHARFFFLPSLLGPCEPADTWTYKTSDSWKTTLCHSVLYPDGVPPGLMERLSASVLSSMHAISHPRGATESENTGQPFEGQMKVKEVLCWRTAFYVKIGTIAFSTDGSPKESIVEIFTHLADKESHLCVGSNYMSVGTRRLITSGRGQVGAGGIKIWNGGYLLVLRAVHRVMEVYGGLEYEKQGVCPECLAKKAVSEAAVWDQSSIRTAVQNSEETLRCQHGHRVDTRLVAGPVENLQRRTSIALPYSEGLGHHVIPVQELLRSVVVVGLWDAKSRKIIRVGSGFIVDKKRGLIVTASHTLMNIWGDKNYPFGENYYGLPEGKVVIGVIPDVGDDDDNNSKGMAVFRYFAKIVAKDPNMEKGECYVDACVLRITTRLEEDVGGNGEGCGDQPEILLLNDEKAMKRERLRALKLTDKCELDEQVRILGYNQGGDGLLGPGERLNRFVDFARGYVCMKFAHDQQSSKATPGLRRDRFKPREEVVVMCPTIGGHSGGPCVNQQGEVIGILSRADPTEKQRSYISPTYEWKALVKEAKRML